jgi:uncharacterized protein (TIGR02145 family)
MMKKSNIILTLTFTIAVFTGCKKEPINDEIKTSNISDKELLITLNTLPVEKINGRGAVVTGNISFGQDIIGLGVGVCWDEAPSPTVDHQKKQGFITFSNSDTEMQRILKTGDSLDFCVIISGLLVNTKYHIRSYIETGGGIVYGNEKSFVTGADSKEGKGLVDPDGNKYKTVVIGEQEWMAENLRTSKYANGDAIPNIEDRIDWVNTSSGASCSLNNNLAEDIITGKIYNWHAIIDSRNVCPTGWHVAQKTDWDKLLERIASDGFEDYPMSEVVGGHDYDAGYYGFNNSWGSVRYGTDAFEGPEYCKTAGGWWSLEKNDSVKIGMLFDLGKMHFVNYENYNDPSYNVRCVK